jgi:hypothetical protein
MKDERGLPFFASNLIEAQDAAAFTTDVLVACSRLFRGDLEQFMVLAFVARAHFEDRGRGGVSASSLAAQCGLPRETVRRKLGLLASRGCVRQTSDHLWRLTDDEFSTGALVARALAARGSPQSA